MCVCNYEYMYFSVLFFSFYLIILIIDMRTTNQHKKTVLDFISFACSYEFICIYQLNDVYLFYVALCLFCGSLIAAFDS